MKLLWTVVLAIATLEEIRVRCVLVEFSDTLTAEDGKRLIPLLENVINQSSEILQTATGTGLPEVTFSLPESWDTSEWEIEVTLPPVEVGEIEADISVNPTNDSTLGKNVGTIQFGPCGTPGLRISIPTAFLEEETVYPKGKALAREWLKYRYGVFDENGFPGDDMYPLFTAVAGDDEQDFTVTDCTNHPVSYILLSGGKKCSVEDFNNRTCSVRARKESRENVTSSFMYYHKDLRNMDYICGKDAEGNHPHNPLSPSKQNILCSSKSIWDVIKSSKNFVQETPEAQEKVQFKYTQKENISVVVAWDNTNRMTSKGRILNSVKKILYDLPIGSKYALFPFTDEPVTKNYPLINITDSYQNRPSNIPSNFVKQVDACTKCAIEKALEILTPEGNPDNKLLNRHAIIISAAKPEKDDGLLNRAKSSSVCFIFLVFGNEETSEDGFKDYAEASRCGGIWHVSFSDDQKSEFEKMYAAMETVLPKSMEGKEKKTIETGYLSHTTAVTVSLESTMEKVIFWFFSSIEQENVQFTFEGKDVEMVEEVSADILVLSLSVSQNGNLSCILKHEMPEVLLQVQKISHQDNYFTGDIRIENNSTASQQQPVIVYAIVYYGSYPVQNANVTAVITRPDNQEIEMELFDNGRGDPDITKNDGIYSRYFVNFSGEGEYNVKINVINTETTVAGKIIPEKYFTCCGSSVMLGSLTLPTFHETFTSTFTAVGGRPPEGYKPSNIRDLRIVSIDTKEVVLSWTAPGAEADHGTVFAYLVKVFSSRDDASNFEKSVHDMNFTADLLPVGKTQTLEIHWNEHLQSNQQYFVAIKSQNENSTSDVSNVIEMLLPDSDDHITITPTPEEEDDKKSGSVNQRTVWIVVGTILGLIVLVLLIYAFIACFVVKPKKKKRDEESKNGNTNPSFTQNENQELNAVTSIPASALLKHHNEVLKAKNENKTPPIFNARDITHMNIQENDEKGETNSDNQINSNSETMPPKSPKRITPV